MKLRPKMTKIASRGSCLNSSVFLGRSPTSSNAKDYLTGYARFHRNRQLAKILSGNEVRGKVAISAMQLAVNFTRSLSRWPGKVS